MHSQIRRARVARISTNRISDLHANVGAGRRYQSNERVTFNVRVRSWRPNWKPSYSPA